jgi:UDP-N-acetylmuramoyl-L-alanyl-D-glutamate--2,6-diaminopimelate ligase
VRLRRERCEIGGSAAVLETPSGSIEVRTPLLGRFNLDNVAAAASCALSAGCPVEAVAEGAAALHRVPGRLERIDAGQPFAVLVDYAHTPEALARLLEAARALSSGRILLVFGCGGERDRGKRPVMGRIAAEGADVVFLASDNPRGEDPEAILREIEAGMPPGGNAPSRRIVPDRAEAIAAAVAAARPGDVVLLAGKGHETTQTVGDRVLHLDDRELAKAALATAGFGVEGRHAGA